MECALKRSLVILRFMRLKKLFKNISSVQIKGSKELEVSGICSNSKLVSPGNLFIAKKGVSGDDGSRYIPEAVAAGASAVLTDIYDPSLKQVVQVIHPDPSKIEGKVATEYFEDPSKELLMVGITGTNGKTTTSFLAKFLLDKLEGLTGLIGTIEYIIGKQRYQAVRTTPDVVSNHKMLREMCNQGCKAAVMEVTSHALHQGRVSGIDFDIALFTNLTLDHLDYHGTMEEYCATKSRLFKSLGQEPSEKRKKKPAIAIVNADSPWSSKILEGCHAKVFKYSLHGAGELNGRNLLLTGSGTQFDLEYNGKIYPCTVPLVGRFNVYNCLGAIAVALSAGHSLERILPLLTQIPSVPGRLEAVPNSRGLKIYVDFAHSDDALQNVLETLTEFKKGKIVTVFGCGGDRDAGKRPKMAEVSEQYSELTIVTSDNPRSEDPESICRHILGGFTKADSFMVELDRRVAIQKAIDQLGPEDILLIAGKGHETYQIFAHKTIEFDDRKVAAEICARRVLEHI